MRNRMESYSLKRLMGVIKLAAPEEAVKTSKACVIEVGGEMRSINSEMSYKEMVDEATKSGVIFYLDEMTAESLKDKVVIISMNSLRPRGKQAVDIANRKMAGGGNHEEKKA